MIRATVFLNLHFRFNALNKVLKQQPVGLLVGVWKQLRALAATVSLCESGNISTTIHSMDS